MCGGKFSKLRSLFFGFRFGVWGLGVWGLDTPDIRPIVSQEQRDHIGANRPRTVLAIDVNSHCRYPVCGFRV